MQTSSDESKYLNVYCNAVTKQSWHGDLVAVMSLVTESIFDSEYGP